MLEKTDKNIIENKIINILSDKLSINLNDIKKSSSLVNDLGIDSFGGVQLLFAIKEEFELEIPFEDFKKINNVSDITEYVLEKVEKV